jgi:beta-lactamase class A
VYGRGRPCRVTPKKRTGARKGGGTTGCSGTPREAGIAGETQREHRARSGVFAWDTATGRRIHDRGGELFPVCSVFTTGGG